MIVTDVYIWASTHKQGENMKLKKVTSLMDLHFKAKTDPDYEQLAIVAAVNLGANPTGLTLDNAMRWLRLNAEDGGTEQGVVDEVNGCRDLVVVTWVRPKSS